MKEEENNKSEIKGKKKYKNADVKDSVTLKSFSNHHNKCRE